MSSPGRGHLRSLPVFPKRTWFASSTRFCSGFFPEKTWACLWVNFDCKKLPHRDSQNASGSENFTFLLCDFQGGGLWLHCPSASSAGTVLVVPPSAIEGMPGALGQVVDTNRRPFAFPAAALHATMLWERPLVVGHSIHLPMLAQRLLCGERAFAGLGVSSGPPPSLPVLCSAHLCASLRWPQALPGPLLRLHSPALRCF